METTFMTIHNLSPEANIQWASESIFEVLGYQQHEVTGKSCFEYFHPDEIPFARMVHNKGLALDKAAVLHYARIKGKTGEWIGCECVFTVVHDVLVACTSIYKGDENNDRRAAIAPAIRRIFSSSPRDPRYHMLEELSVKFRSPPQAALREPRAALILNRFSRELPILYATSAVQGILGVSAEQITGKAFYECIQENCLPEAIRCLESAKANDSIAYLRFWYRDPRRPEDLVQNDEEMQDANHSSDSEDGGVELHSPMVLDPNSAEGSAAHQSRSQSAISSSGDDSGANQGAPLPSRTSSGDSSEAEHAADQVFDGSAVSRSSTSSLAVSPGVRRARPEQRPAEARPEPFELEAVISCTSDGLVVVLRRARPIVPDAMQQQVQYPNGLFAAPWGADPIRAHQFRADDPRLAFRHGLQIPQPQIVGGPPADQFLQTIREVAVFAWSLAGINGNIASYGRGTPRGEAQPPAGLPIWDPRAQPGLYVPPQNQAAERWMHVDERTRQYGHDYRLPYQYRWHQEQSLTYQPGLGIGPIVPPPQTVPADAWNGQHYRNPGYDIYANIFHGQNVSNQSSGYGDGHAGWNGGAQHPKPDQGPAGGNPGHEY